MAAKPGAGLVWTPESGVCFRILQLFEDSHVGARALGLRTPSQLHHQGAGLEVEQPWLEPVLIWDGHTVGRGLTYKIVAWLIERCISSPFIFLKCFVNWLECLMRFSLWILLSDLSLIRCLWSILLWGDILSLSTRDDWTWPAHAHSHISFSYNW